MDGTRDVRGRNFRLEAKIDAASTASCERSRERRVENFRLPQTSCLLSLARSLDRAAPSSRPGVARVPLPTSGQRFARPCSRARLSPHVEFVEWEHQRAAVEEEEEAAQLVTKFLNGFPFPPSCLRLSLSPSVPHGSFLLSPRLRLPPLPSSKDQINGKPQR